MSKIESTTIDYKLKLEEGKPKSWLKSVSAFANTIGGHIVFGVDNDTRKKIGLDDPQQTATKISEYIVGRISPRPIFEITEIKGDIPGRNCLDLMITNGPNYPYYYAYQGITEAYVRHGDRSEKALDYELSNLILKGKHQTFDALPSHYSLPDVSFTLLAATYKMETGDEMVLPRDLISMGLCDVDHKITNAGLLLSDQGILRQSKIVCTRWKGTTKGSVDIDALDDKEFENESLISLLKDAESFVRNNSKNSWTIRGMRREENSDYSYRAVREVLVNALIHRDYQIIGSEIHVDMFDDRLEIISPGGMINGRRIQELDLRKVPSMRRNEIISDFFGRLHYMDRRGSGISRILDSYVGFSVQPVFTSDVSSFFVMLPNRSFRDSVDISEKTQLTVEKTQLDDINDQLTEDDETIEIQEYWKKLALKHKSAFREKSIEQLTLLFEKYEYSYTFNRRNISELFSISENSASRIIAKCLKLGIFAKEQKDTYRFEKRDK